MLSCEWFLDVGSVGDTRGTFFTLVTWMSESLTIKPDFIAVISDVFEGYTPCQLANNKQASFTSIHSFHFSTNAFRTFHHRFTNKHSYCFLIAIVTNTSPQSQ